MYTMLNSYIFTRHNQTLLFAILNDQFDQFCIAQKRAVWLLYFKCHQKSKRIRNIFNSNIENDKSSHNDSYNEEKNAISVICNIEKVSRRLGKTNN